MSTNNVSEPITSKNTTATTTSDITKNGKETVPLSDEDGTGDPVEGPACKASSSSALMSSTEAMSSFTQQQHDEWDDNDNGEEEEDMTDAYEPQQLLQQHPHSKEGEKSSLTYHPFMLPSDQSLKDARTRLHTALEQTRILRETFTKRLWEKYNIKMTPVESSIEEIVGRCLTDTALSQIQQTQNIWSWEKRIEGILDPPLVPMLTGASSALPSGAGGGSGGFSGIILPEDEQYYRNENNTFNSGMNKRISGASAAAAKIILERARTNAVARSFVFSDKDKAKYGSNGPIAVCLKSVDVAHLVEKKKLHSILKKRRWSVANIPRGGVVQLQPNTNVGVMGKEVLGGPAAAAVTVVHAPNLQSLLIEDDDENLKTATSTAKTLSTQLPSASTTAPIPSSLTASSAPTTTMKTGTNVVRRVTAPFDTNNRSNILTIHPVSSLEEQRKPSTFVATTTSISVPSNAATTGLKTAATVVPRTTQLTTAVGSATAKTTSHPHVYQKRVSSSGANIQLIQQQYGVDLALDENLILFHKSSSSYKTKILRHLSHGHHTIPSLIDAWSLVTCQRLLSYEKNNYYMTPRMGLRDAFIKRHLLPKLLMQQQEDKSSSNTLMTNPQTATHLLPPPWKWIENSSNLVLKDGACILRKNSNFEDQNDVITGIGQVLDIFYTTDEKDIGNQMQEVNDIKPVVVSNVSVAHAMKFKLSNNLNSKKHQRLPQDKPGTSAEVDRSATMKCKNKKLPSSYDSVTVYSVLAALGLLCNSKTFDEDNEAGRFHPKYSAGSSSLPPPKFVEGQHVEALWQSPHEAHFSRPSTPYSSVVEISSLSTATRRLSSGAGFADADVSAALPPLTTTTDARNEVAKDVSANKTSTTTKGSWYPAVITRVVYKPHIVDSLNLLGPEGSEYRYDVSYDDGDIDEGLKVYQIRAPTLTLTASGDSKYSANKQHDSDRTTSNNIQSSSCIKENSKIFEENVSKSIILSYRRSLSTIENHSCLRKVTDKMEFVKDANAFEDFVEKEKVSENESNPVDGKSPSFNDNTLSQGTKDINSTTALVLESFQSEPYPYKPTINSKLTCYSDGNDVLKRDEISLPSNGAKGDCSEVISEPTQSKESIASCSSFVIPPKFKKARMDSSLEREKLGIPDFSVAAVNSKQKSGQDSTVGAASDSEESIIPAPSTLTRKEKKHCKKRKESSSENTPAAPVATESSCDLSSRQPSNLDLPFWQRASNEPTDLEQALQWHAASMIAAPSPFLMCPPQFNQVTLPSLGHSSLSNLQGTSAVDSFMDHRLALSLAPSQLLYATSNNDFRVRSAADGQIFPLGMSTASSGITDAYARALSLTNNNGQGINAWERTNPFFQSSQAAGIYQMAQHNALLNSRAAFMLGASRGLMTLPAMHIQAQQQAAAQMQQLLMSSAAKWAPPRPHTAHSFSPRITGSTGNATNAALTGTHSVSLRPSSAGSLTSQSLSAGMAGSARDFFMVESLPKSYGRFVESAPAQPTYPALETSHATFDNSSSTRSELESLPKCASLSKVMNTEESISLSSNLVPKSTETGSPAVSFLRSGESAVEVLPKSSEMGPAQDNEDVPLSSSDASRTQILNRHDGANTQCPESSLVEEKSVADTAKSIVVGSTPREPGDCAANYPGNSLENTDISNSITAESSTPTVNDPEQKISGRRHITRSSPSLDGQPVPPVESFLSKNYPDVATLIEQGKFPKNLVKFCRLQNSDKGVSTGLKDDLINGNELDKAAVDYLLQLGSAIPIARTWVVPEMKRKWAKFPPLNMLGIGGRSCPLFAVREVLSAVVSLWVWHNYRPLFQRAVTAKSHIGVDNESKIFHECNFIVETAVECCLLNIAREILTMGGVPFHHSTCSFNSAAIASIASQVLNGGVSVNPETDHLLVPSNLEVELSNLDKNRFKALQLMIYERVLLTTFVARTMIMTEKYAYSYLKFMLVVGEAVGHAKVCQLVNDDTLYDPCILSSSNVAVTPSSFNYGSIWTFLPYDFVTSEDDELGFVLQDPCKPRYGGFTQGMDKDELISRAHAKALLQRCLCKLQQKYGFQGGTTEIGPYEEYDNNNDVTAPSKSASNSLDSGIQHIPLSVASFGVPLSAPTPGTPRAAHQITLKRKSSFTGREIDATGGASHVGALLYPAHYCAPLVVNSHDIQRFSSLQADEDTSPLQKKPRTSASSVVPTIVRSTEPIDWYEVANLFQPVAVPDQVAPTGSIEQSVNIFAPDVRKLDKPVWELTEEDYSDNDDDSEAEDISDDAVLARHQKVLDLMKQKLDVAMVHRSQGRGRTLPTGGSSRVIK